MEYLYVCHFGNGHIKVGRAKDPAERIAQHKARVACLGVHLLNSSYVVCVGPIVAAEAALLDRCAKACTAQHLNEWFEGLSYAEVTDWAFFCAALSEREPIAATEADGSVNFKVLVRGLMAHGVTQAQIAAHCGCHQCTISDLANGKTTDPFYSMGVKLLALHASKLSA